MEAIKSSNQTDCSLLLHRPKWKSKKFVSPSKPLELGVTLLSSLQAIDRAHCIRFHNDFLSKSILAYSEVIRLLIWVWALNSALAEWWKDSTSETEMPIKVGIDLEFVCWAYFCTSDVIRCKVDLEQCVLVALSREISKGTSGKSCGSRLSVCWRILQLRPHLLVR